MEFSNRGMQSQTTDASQGSNIPVAKHGGKKSGNDKWKRLGVVVAGAAVTVLVIGVIVLLATGNKKSEASYVDSSKLQAVFLNTGQVYFGNIKSLNDDYVRLTNIYYLQTSNGNNADASSQNTNVSLVKLGCELHEPLDQMLINSEQVTFWENLGDNGQVAQAVAKFEKDNPDGQKCADQSSSASSNSGSNAQNATTNNSSNTSNSSTNSNSNTNTNNNQ